jgi:hypothetical protein
VRSLGVFISFFFPLIYIIIGIILAKVVGNSINPDDNPDYTNIVQIFIMVMLGLFTTIAFAYTTSTIVGHPVMER